MMRYFCVGQKIGDTLLFFGCRRKSEDYLYEEELNSYLEEGTLKDLQVAFSRDQVLHNLVNIAVSLFRLNLMSKWVVLQGDNVILAEV